VGREDASRLVQMLYVGADGDKDVPWWNRCRIRKLPVREILNEMFGIPVNARALA